ncbi:alpha-glucosides ABC transporter, ATP-binding protein [Fulvimarina pelagi HTCC2506]|uniref:Alpha-glucosides ABC transporter, ATP-binding protein n=1 Tax=Fulvimarina pelagi HTCC2506 TaxID=314231 RepID=Q0G3Y6_9HYPH|nr:sn-glycerol-3-phosphate ABC transporter ATP-binding protein UgpC [Fulvimarina pelagi]EAU41695.1 alpha-glucosides ABC transporter, ATP-binding protein [Fulvimarina pelagi HTCC2506]
MASVKLTKVEKAFGAVKVLHGIDLQIEQGEFIVFVGPSGCGKSTLLRLIAGLEDITGGNLEIDGKVVNDKSPKERGIAMVFQSYALYPHMTVYENMAFGLKLDKSTGKDEMDTRIREAARVLQIEDYLERLPKALSGGQRQRVAIGRAITRNPKVFLFDEPLSNLDAALRVQTRIEIAGLHEKMSDTTMIYVTHDQVEAMTLADKIVVLNKGHVEQVGSPIDLYERPNNLFVARFIGSPAMNILPARIGSEGDRAQATIDGLAPLTLPEPRTVAAGGSGYLGVRPEDLALAGEEEADFMGRVSLVERLGEVTLLYVDIGTADAPLVAKIPGSVPVERDQRIALKARREALQLFDQDGDAIHPD